MRLTASVSKTASAIGLWMMPGATAFTVMPRDASSRLRAFVALFSPPLAAA